MPVRFITPTPRCSSCDLSKAFQALENARATSPATAPSMPVPAFYAAPARNMPGSCLISQQRVLHVVTPPQSLQQLPGYPSFGGLSVSL